MFGIDSSELAVIALVALVVIGPKDLPRVMRQLGQWLAKGRAMSRHVRSGFDTMMREAELEEMQKAWAAQNEAIIKASAMPDLGLANPMAQLGQDDLMTPLPPPILPETTEAASAPVPDAGPAPKPRRKAANSTAVAPSKAPRKRAPKAAPVPATVDSVADTAARSEP